MIREKDLRTAISILPDHDKRPPSRVVTGLGKSYNFFERFKREIQWSKINSRNSWRG